MRLHLSRNGRFIQSWAYSSPAWRDRIVDTGLIYQVTYVTDIKPQRRVCERVD
jgi:hypothetical protein